MFNDPTLRDLATRVEVVPDEACEAVYPAHFGSRVTLQLTSGASKTALTLDPHGTPADPCSDAELDTKFKRLAALSPLAVDANAMTQAVLSLDARMRVSELSRLLRAGIC